MGSDATLQIPIVELSDVNLKPGTQAWAAARAQIRAALDCYSCFEALYDGVTPELREAAFRATKELFALPVEAKVRNVSDKAFHGYIGQVPGFPYESLAVNDVLDPTAARSFTDLMWPQGNPTFCGTVGDFAVKAAELEKMVRRMVLESLGVDKHYDSHTESTKYVLRFSEYAPPAGFDEEGAKLSLPPHLDPNLCTLIYQQNQIDGLQVQARSGDWIPFTPSSPNSVIFVIGEALRAWSNERLLSTPHRVGVRPGETRYSVMLFAVPKDDAVIEAPGELVDDGCPPRFRPYRYPEYVEFSKSSRKAGAGGGDLMSTLTAFCGTTAGGVQPMRA